MERVEKLLVLSALSYGSGALAPLRERGVVRAVLSNGIHLESENGDLVGLVDSRKADGPITIKVDGMDGALVALEGMVEGSFSGDGSILNICDRVKIYMSKARQWVPPAIMVRANNRELHKAIAELHSAIWAMGAKSGLGPLASAISVPFQAKKDLLDTSYLISGDPVLRRAASALIILKEAWEEGDTERAAGSATRLLGLGPGLTPSGDDLLAGLLATLKWFGRYNEHAEHMGRSVGEAVVKEASLCTTRLSTQLLGYAANGLLYEPGMSLGAALMAGHNEKIAPASLRLFEIGHTSGTDMAVGILMGAMLCTPDAYP